MPTRILVINPNSSAEVTGAIDRALDPLRRPGGPSLVTVSLAEGPPGIESDADVSAAGSHVCAAIAREPADAYVIACFSDPGLGVARAATGAPVFGIAESAFCAALSLGDRFGVVSILEVSIARHRRYVDALRLGGRLAGDRAIGLGVTALADEGAALDRIVEVGRQLRDRDGADVLILGCAGMARYRARVEDALALPVIDPTQAAVAQALAAIALGWRRRALPKESRC